MLSLQLVLWICAPAFYTLGHILWRHTKGVDDMNVDQPALQQILCQHARTHAHTHAHAHIDASKSWYVKYTSEGDCMFDLLL